MKLSIIICYRNREEHLIRLIPSLKEALVGQDFEIIVAEQNDTFPFKRGNLLNEGAKASSGDILVLHDVDYVPSKSVKYWKNDADVFRPVSKVNFILMDNTNRPEEDIPSGYRTFKDKIDDDFFGGVLSINRDAFFQINGYNSLYDGWGLEDADLRERINLHDLTVMNGDGIFSALPHADSFPGIGDENFKNNQVIFNEWMKHLGFGVNTTFCTSTENADKAKKYNIDKWIEVSRVVNSSDDLIPFMTINNICEYYKDDPLVHTKIWNSFKYLVNNFPMLKAHRDWVVQNNWGYGNRAFHWMWFLLIKEMPLDFKFLEIGVFKGQIISLVSMLNFFHSKNGKVFGITPLSKSGDKYATHPDINYYEAIQFIYSQFNLDGNDLSIIEGFSNNQNVINMAEKEGPFDLVYIDGSHDYEVVCSDIINYSKMIKKGGYLILDDASCNLNIPDGLIRLNWRGLPDVCRAVSDTIEKDINFDHCFAIGHNRIFQKIN